MAKGGGSIQTMAPHPGCAVRGWLGGKTTGPLIPRAGVIPQMNDGIRGASKGPPPLTTMLGQEATVDDTVAGRDTAEPDISGGTRDRPRRDPVPRRESRIGRGPLDPGRPSPSPGSGAGRRAWRELAACQGMDSRGFSDLSGNRRPPGRRASRAKRVCAGCSVVPDCRAFALHTGGPTGLGWALRVRARRNVGVNSRVQLTESAPRPTARAHRPERAVLWARPS